MKNEILVLVEVMSAVNGVLPGNVHKTATLLRSVFTEVREGLYWKETPNGVLSFNSTSVMFQKNDGTNEILYENCTGNPVISFVSSLDLISFWVYVKITKEERLLSDKVLMHWFNKNKHNI